MVLTLRCTTSPPVKRSPLTTESLREAHDDLASRSWIVRSQHLGERGLVPNTHRRTDSHAHSIPVFDNLAWWAVKCERGADHHADRDRDHLHPSLLMHQGTESPKLQRHHDRRSGRCILQ